MAFQHSTPRVEDSPHFIDDSTIISPESNSDEFELIEPEEANLTPEDLANLQKWLQPTDYMAESSEFNRHLSSQAPGTGLWICDTPRFQQWHDSDDHSSLWIKGVPGAGKSVTAASMIEHLQRENVPVLFFFFRYIILANRRPRSLVRDWLAQLLPHSLQLQATLQPLMKGELDGISDDELWEYLLAGLSSIERAYCVVDAMDEMEQVPNDRFLQRLNALATFRPACVKLLLTSRPKQYLQSALRDASIVHISLEQDLVGRDIAAFVSHRLRNVLSDGEQQQLRESLQSTICTRSQGLFLYARLLLDQIIPTLTSTEQLDVESLANTLPIGLEDMYNSMLFQQAKALKIDTAIQIFLLACATHSSRPLRLNELANFLEFVFSSSDSPGGTPKEIARSACAPLLEIAEDETVQVIHHSFTEFLLDTERISTQSRGIHPEFPALAPKDVHKLMAIQCLEYLQSGVLGPNYLSAEEKDAIENACKCDGDPDCHRRKKHHPKTIFKYQEARLQHPFLEYAVTNWSHHASCYDVEDEDFFAAIGKFVNTDNAAFHRWVSLEWDVRRARPEVPSALHIAAFSGLGHFTKRLLLEGNNIDSLDATERTPLQWACRQGHTDVVSLLLKSGAKPDPDNYQGVKPIHEAAKRNHASIVKILLEAGVEPLTPKSRQDHGGRLLGGERSTKGETAVEYVYQRGHTETILVMLPFLKQDTVEELLCESCHHSKPGAVQAILENSNVSVNCKSYRGTPLYIACNARNPKCVDLLLARGADANQISDWSPKNFLGRRETLRRKNPMTPLLALVSGWEEKHNAACHHIFRSLLKAGVDVEAKDIDGQTALLNLFGEQKILNQKAVMSLLEAGADATVTKDGDNILHRFLKENRDIKFIELLLQHGCSIEDRGNNGNTVLHTALLTSYPTTEPNTIDEVIEFLLEKGARSDIKDDYGRTVLELAISSCSMEVFRRLLQSCPDMDTRTRCLWKIERRGETVNFIRELISAGVSIEARDPYGRPALVVHCRDERIFDALLECGANLHAVDPDGKGVLHNYVSTPGTYNSLERLRKLVEKGLDPHLLDNYGNNLLHIAVPSFRGVKQDIEFIQQILDFGISPNAKNKEGQTPLMVHIEHGRVGSSANETKWVPLLELFQNQTKGYKLDIDAQDNEGMTALHFAVTRSEAHVARLIDTGAYPTIVTKKGQNLLHLASRARKSNILGFLLSNPANREMIDKADSSGKTALHEACASGRPESVYYLLKYGANVKIRDGCGRTPLHSCADFAAKQHLWSTVQIKAEEAARNKDRAWPASSRRTGLPWPTDEETMRVSGIMTALISAGADVDATDSDGCTPLDRALSNGRQEMVKSLQSQMRGCGVNDMDANLRSVVAQQEPQDSLHSLSQELQQKVLKKPSKYLSFISPEDVDWIIKNGGDITGADNDFTRESILHTAASLGLTEIMGCLGERVRFFDDTEFMIKILQTSKEHNYAENFAPVLQVACQRELPNLEILELLLKFGVDINARAVVASPEWMAGPTALHRLAEAKSWWQIDAIKLLVEKGAKIDEKNEKGETALHISSVGNAHTNMGEDEGFWKPACVEVLLDLGADPTILDNNGRSCLDKAGAAPEIMRILLKRGGDLKASALFSAIQSLNTQALGVLLDEGVSVNAVDSSNSCMVHYEVKDQKKFALFCAAFPYPFNKDIKDSVPLVKLLIERGADLYAPLNDHEMLIHYVFEHSEYEIACAFLDCADKIDFDRRDQLGRTVFLAACNFTNALPGFRHKHWFTKEAGPYLKIMSNHKADLTAIDNEGRNALHHLLDNPDAELDHILEVLKHPVSKKLFKRKDNKGFTPLSLALRTLRPAVCESLMNMGADLLEPDPNGATALHHIATQWLQVHAPHRRSRNFECHKPEFYEGSERLWQKFSDLGGDINARDNEGCTPLFSYLASPVQRDYRDKDENNCCHVGSLDKFFANADLNARNSDGETAMHVIARREKTYKLHDSKLFEFVVGKGLDPLIEDKRGRSSLDVAAACGQKEILNLFQYRS